MTHLIFILVAISRAQSPQADTAWPSGMGSGKIASQSLFVQKLGEAVAHPHPLRTGPQATPRAHSPKASAASHSPAKSQQVVVRSADPDDPGLRAYLAHLDAVANVTLDERDRCIDLIRAGKTSEARARLEQDLLQTGNDLYVDPLMDLELAKGDYASAYKVAVPFVRGGRAPERILMRASMAAAGVGEVYPGQREFVMGYFLRTFGAIKGEFFRLLPKADSAQAVLALSAIAASDDLDPDDALPLEEVALRIYPTNPIFCFDAAMCYRFVGKYTKAVQTLESGLKEAGTGFYYNSITYFIGVCRKDLRTYGDGHLYHPPRAPSLPHAPGSGSIRP